MNLELLIILIIMIIFIIIFLYIEPLFMKHKVKNSNEYGSARFSTPNEIKKNFKSENINNIKEAGFPVSFSNDLRTIYFDRETPHYVYLGSTGSGKSVTAVIPTCSFIAHAKRKKSIFIFPYCKSEAEMRYIALFILQCSIISFLPSFFVCL